MGNGKAILIFGLLGLGLLFLLTRKSSGYSSESGVATIPFKPYAKVKGGHHYSNEETWDIVWSKDGLPTKVTINRSAYQT